RASAGLVIDLCQLEIREGRETVVAAGLESLEIFFRFCVALELLQAERVVIAGDPAGLRACVAPRNLGKLLSGIAVLVLLVDVSELTWLGGLGGGANARIVDAHGVSQLDRSTG